MYAYFQENNLLSSEQFGFRPHLSTDVALTQLFENILDNLDNGSVTGAVFLDLKKAFDTVDHITYDEKTSFLWLGYKRIILVWVLFVRSQTSYFYIENCLSTSRRITIGVPQGSILGPLLFIIYVNDLPRCLNHSKIILHADDTLIYYSAKLAQDVETCLNNDLKSVAQWFHSNLLTLNCDKNRYLLFGSRRFKKSFKNLKSFNTTSVQINEWPLERESSLKYLGVILNEDMSWSDHIENLIRKSNQRSGSSKENQASFTFRCQTNFI